MSKTKRYFYPRAVQVNEKTYEKTNGNGNLQTIGTQLCGNLIHTSQFSFVKTLDRDTFRSWQRWSEVQCFDFVIQTKNKELTNEKNAF